MGVATDTEHVGSKASESGHAPILRNSRHNPKRESYVYHQTALRKTMQCLNNNSSHFLWVYELNGDGFTRHILAVKKTRGNLTFLCTRYYTARDCLQLDVWVEEHGVQTPHLHHQCGVFFRQVGLK